MTQPPPSPDGQYPPQQGFQPPQPPQPGYPPQPPQGYQQPGPQGYQQPAPGGYPQGQAVANPDVEQNKIYAVLAYIGFLVLIPIFAAKESRFARYHANQGLTLFIIEIACLVLSMVTWVFVRSLSALLIVSLINFILGLIYLGCFVFMIIGIINAVQGNEKPLPLIGGVTILK
ncbi:MAG: hypothetical protein LBJ02_09510 [Bifidobacteriaceae bacterium]|jgi:uncharacterized membrane protein|nr:hypothetical protein [Bifidobacteriaceae bacterium]